MDRQIQDQTLPDKSTQKSQKRLTLQAVYVADETRRDERRRDEGQGGGKWKRWGKSQKKKKKKNLARAEELRESIMPDSPETYRPSQVIAPEMATHSPPHGAVDEGDND